MKVYSFSKKFAKLTFVISFLAVGLTVGSAIFYSRYSADEPATSVCSIENSPSVSVNTSSKAVEFGPNLSGQILNYKIYANMAILKQGSLITSSITDQGTIVPLSIAQPGNYMISAKITDSGGCETSATGDITIQDVVPTDCSVYNSPATVKMPDYGTVTKPGADLNVVISNSSDKLFYASVSITDGKGNWLTPYDMNRVPAHDSKTFNFRPQFEGKHHLKAETYLDGCDLGTYEIEFCVSSAATCGGSESLTAGPTTSAPAGGGSGPTGLTGGSVSDQDIHSSPIVHLDDLIYDRILPNVSILIGILSFVGIIVGGYLYLTAGPNESQAEKGKKALTYSIIGLVIGVLSYWIVTAVLETLKTNL